MSNDVIDRRELYNKVSRMEEEAREKYLYYAFIKNSFIKREEWETKLYERTMFKHMIADIPAADVVPVVKGKWIIKKGVLHPLEIDGICSKCGYTTSFYYMHNFCPNCGADMREVANDER